MYAGITNDVSKRYEAHCSGKGAKYTRANPPVRLLATCPFPDQSEASKAEYRIKKLPTARKMRFLLDAGGSLAGAV